MNKGMIVIYTIFCIIFLTSSFNLVRAEEVEGEFLSLEEAINEAILRNPLIREASEKNEAARSEYKGAIADMLPKFSASYSYIRMKEHPVSLLFSCEVFLIFPVPFF